MRKLKKRIQAYFLTGLLIVLPLAISLTVLSWLFVKLSDVVFPVIPLPKPYLTDVATLKIFFRVLALLFLFSLVTVIGFVATNVLGKKLLKLGENLLAKIPLFNKVYMVAKQIIQAFLGEKNTLFEKVVAFEYPRKGIYSVGFISGEASKKLFSELLDKTYMNVFIPTVPNPTSGFFILVPKEDITVLDLSVEDGFKFIISGGLVLPPKYIDDHDRDKKSQIKGKEDKWKLPLKM
ncbi:DUF502 domain-containing protein [Candidatus Auribacterota bacterium]